MVSRKEMANGPIATPLPSAPISTTMLPAALRFPLLVLFSLTLSSIFYTLSSAFTAGDLSSVSRSLNEWWEVAGLVAWKTTELAIGWWGEYDGIDLASLTVLSHFPPLYLLTTFYAIRPTTILASLAIDTLTTYIPFRLLRPIHPTHAPSPPPRSISNRPIIHDSSVLLWTTLLAAAIHAVLLYLSLITWLPLHLVLHFDGLRDISAAHGAALPYLLAASLPLGYAAREFLFTPATGARRDLAELKATAFNPETASLAETLWYNFWGFSKRTRTLVVRTATLVAVVGVHTWVQVFVTVEGTEAYGAAGGPRFGPRRPG
ncbi:MAG: hypothetical protein FRX48_08288 [Lasallia pustulata]|uniref:Uncharacterized protein n=1 Tax=Lasallia pustulata TaxID=136370 RepID=A0A5M8PF61_9LECA|nr:MAG: hypothetical protein FRX48_08288 [Lasallia pustulata]